MKSLDLEPFCFHKEKPFWVNSYHQACCLKLKLDLFGDEIMSGRLIIKSGDTESSSGWPIYICKTHSQEKYCLNKNVLACEMIFGGNLLWLRIIHEVFNSAFEKWV